MMTNPSPGGDANLCPPPRGARAPAPGGCTEMDRAGLQIHRRCPWGPDPGAGRGGRREPGRPGGGGASDSPGRSRPVRGSPATRGPAKRGFRGRGCRRGGGSGTGSQGGNRRGKFGNNPARAPFPLPSGVSHRGGAGHPEGVPLRARVRDGNNLPADRSATLGGRSGGGGSACTGGTPASRTPAPKPPQSAPPPAPRGAQGQPLPAGQSPPSPAPDATRGLPSARPNTHLSDAAAGTYRGRSLAARRRALPIGPDSARAGLRERRPDPPGGGAGAVGLRSGGRAAGQPGRARALLLPRRRRRPRPPRAPPALPRLQAPPPPARPQSRPPPAPRPLIGRRLQAPSAPPCHWALAQSVPRGLGHREQLVRGSQTPERAGGEGTGAARPLPGPGLRPRGEGAVALGLPPGKPSPSSSGPLRLSRRET